MNNFQIKSSSPIYTYTNVNTVNLNKLTTKALCEDIQLIILNILSFLGETKTIYNLSLTCKSWSNKIKTHHLLEKSEMYKIYNSVMTNLYYLNEIPLPFFWKQVLSSVCRNKQTHLLEYLLNENKTIKALLGSSHLCEAIEKECLQTVQVLLNEGQVNPSINKNSAIIQACRQGETNIVSLLLSDPRVDPSANNNISIQWASKNGHTEVVRILLADTRVDPSVENNLAIQHASKNGHTEIVRLLLTDTRVDPSKKVDLIFDLASKKGQANIIEAFIKNKHIALLSSTFLDDILLKAVEKNYIDIVKVLLKDDRINPSIDHNFIIHNAMLLGHHEITRLLKQDKRYDGLADYSLLTAYLIKSYRFCSTIFVKTKAFLLSFF